MSRLFLTCSLIAALSSVAVADRLEEPAAPPTMKFAQPPAHWGAGAPAEARMRMPPRALDRDAIHDKLAAARRANLERFRAYQRTGVFPSNTYSDGKLNVWLDDAGHFCAAATIIRASGQVALVDRVAEQDNFIKLGAVTQGPVMDWILTSGFTQAEIAAIQEPFMPVVRRGAPVEPSVQPVVDPRMRMTEDQRLRARYRQVEAMLVRNQGTSLELAVDRLMAHRALAWSLIDG